jgi:nucleotide-binding universal stress UspA family protein
MKLPFKRILAAIDRSNLARDVFNRALALAQQNHSHLILSHCTSLKTIKQMGTLIDAGFGLVSSAKLRQLDREHHELVNEAYRWLCNYALEAQTQGVFAEIVHEVGEARVQICHLAQQLNADLIVIGSSGKASWKQRLCGSKTEYVARHAPCCVMVVQPEDDTQRLPYLKTPKELVNKSHRIENRMARSMWNLHIPVA